MSIRIYDYPEKHLDCFINSQEVFKNNILKDEFRKNINLIYSELAHRYNTRALTIGKIQSGKTLFFTGMIANFFDMNTDSLCVVLAGTKLSLKDQTFRRLKSDLSYSGINVFNQPSEINLENLNKCVIVILKHKKHIDFVSELLNQTSISNVLIVDDESDQASLNNHNFSNLKNDKSEMSIINSSLLNLMYLNNYNIKYLQITATPQAHLLSGKLDSMRPNFITTIPAHSNYFGNELLFENESKIFHILEGQNSKWEFVTFLLTYFSTCIKLETTYNEVKNISCFVHSSHLNTKNDEYYNLLNEALRLIVSIINNPKSLTSQSFNINDKNNSLYLINNKQYFDIIINDFQIERVYGNHDNNIEWNSYFLNNKYFCLIGGNKLERGFTIPGLITTFFTRISKNKANIDNFEQRCRFFGNRAHLIEFINIFCTYEILEIIREYHLNERIIFNAISENGGFVYKTENLFKFIDNKLTNPTRKSVISLPLYFANGYNWTTIYFRDGDYHKLLNYFNNLCFISIHPNSGNSEMNTHCIYEIEGEILLHLLNDKIYIPNSRDKLNCEILKSLINKEIKYQLIALSNLKLRERNFDRYEGMVRIPNAIHSSSNTGGYIGDSKILNLDSEITIHIGNYKSKHTNEYLFTLTYKLHENNG